MNDETREAKIIKETLKRYGDIIDLPHHQSNRHRHMTLEERAAQFAPFAALTGFDELVDEAGRYTEDYRELTEEELGKLDRQLRELRERIDQRPSVCVRWFQMDPRKAGGKYHTYSGNLKQITDFALIFEDGCSISLPDIVEFLEEG